MKLYIDTREPKKMQKNAKKAGFSAVEYQKLDVGDYIIQEKGIVVERKTMSDFVSSFRSGSLQKQLLQMEENYEHNYLLLIGDIVDIFRNNNITLTVNQYCGMMASLHIRYDVEIAQFQNELRGLKFLESVARKTDDGKEISLEDTELLKNKVDVDDLKLKVLMSFSQIGKKRAKKKLENKEVAETVNRLVELMN